MPTRNAQGMSTHGSRLISLHGGARKNPFVANASCVHVAQANVRDLLRKLPEPGPGSQVNARTYEVALCCSHTSWEAHRTMCEDERIQYSAQYMGTVRCPRLLPTELVPFDFP